MGGGIAVDQADENFLREQCRTSDPFLTFQTPQNDYIPQKPLQYSAFPAALHGSTSGWPENNSNQLNSKALHMPELPPHPAFRFHHCQPHLNDATKANWLSTEQAPTHYRPSPNELLVEATTATQHEKQHQQQQNQHVLQSVRQEDGPVSNVSTFSAFFTPTENLKRYGSVKSSCSSALNDNYHRQNEFLESSAYFCDDLNPHISPKRRNSSVINTKITLEAGVEYCSNGCENNNYDFSIQEHAVKYLVRTALEKHNISIKDNPAGAADPRKFTTPQNDDSFFMKFNIDHKFKKRLVFKLLIVYKSAISVVEEC
eukprot:gene4183-6529_t